MSLPFSASCGRLCPFPPSSESITPTAASVITLLFPLIPTFLHPFSKDTYIVGPLG